MCPSEIKFDKDLDIYFRSDKWKNQLMAVNREKMMSGRFSTLSLYLSIYLMLSPTQLNKEQFPF